MEPTARGDRRVVLAQHVHSHFQSWEQVSAPEFAAFLRSSVLAGARDVYDEADQNGGVEDLAFATALLLAIPDPLTPITSFEKGSGKSLVGVQTAEISDDIGKWVIRNRERYLPLTRWVTYLGLARGINSQGLLVVDPSEALEHLAVPLLDRQLSMNEFLDRLAPVMPYSDRGPIGSSLRRSLNPRPGEDQVSPGLALGLQTLNLRKKLQLTLLSDAESMEFLIGVDRSIRYSHIAPGVAQ